MAERLREPVSGLMHLAGAVAAGVGLIALLIIGRDDGWKELALAIYGLSLVMMFSASAAYHLVRARSSVSRLLRTLDHSAIYLLIAGTYTPVCLLFFTGFWRWGLLVIVWSMAVAGVAVKVFILGAPRAITAGLYLVMGWLALLAVKPMIQTMPAPALVWLLLGGAFFSVGAVIYIAKRPDFFPGVFGFHEVWHIFVILGCLSHFILIAAYVAPRPLLM